jgi:hypothetical protein
MKEMEFVGKNTRDAWRNMSTPEGEYRYAVICGSIYKMYTDPHLYCSACKFSSKENVWCPRCDRLMLRKDGRKPLVRYVVED